MTVIDVAEVDFEREVIARSHEVPVVVDFWAEWCAPCRALGPVLEQATATREGKVVLAKVDTDANPGISQTFGIQGIPAVKAFKDGVVVEEFVGAQGPAMVERFFDLLVPTEADLLVEQGDEAALRQALELQPGPLRRGGRARADPARPRRGRRGARDARQRARRLPVRGPRGADPPHAGARTSTSRRL